MTTDRAQLKLTARGSVADAQPSAKLVTLVFLLLTTVLITIIQRILGDPFREMYQLVLNGYDPEWALYSVFSTVSLPLVAFVNILLALYSSVMGYGYTAYCIRLSRSDGEAGYGTLLEGFSMVGRVILTHILVAVFTILWGLLLAIPFTIVSTLVLTFSNGSGFGVFLFIVLYIAFLVGLVCIALRYAMADYCLFDHPEEGSLAAISRSKLLMQGRRGEFFVLSLSFLGWLILVALLGGVGGAVGAGIGGVIGQIGGAVAGAVLGFLISLPLSLWLNPYMGCTFAHYYNAISGAGESGETPPSTGSFPSL